MSWDCPYLVKDICKLNGISCTPAKGNCVLRGKFEVASPSRSRNQNIPVKKNPKDRFKSI